MTPGDVIDKILHHPDLPPHVGFLEQVAAGTIGKPDERGEPIVMWGVLLDVLRPTPDAPKHTPLTPNEVERVRRALRIMTDAVESAYAAQPAHVYVVPEGGR